MKPSNTIIVSPKYIEEKEHQLADLSKKVQRLQERNEKLEKMAFHYTPEEWNTMMRMIERLQEQLDEANEVIKLYAETTVGHKQKDGTYGMWICSGEVAWENPLDRIKTRIDYVCYDPRPAKKWLKKWGVK